MRPRRRLASSRSGVADHLSPDSLVIFSRTPVWRSLHVRRNHKRLKARQCGRLGMGQMPDHGKHSCHGGERSGGLVPEPHECTVRRSGPLAHAAHAPVPRPAGRNAVRLAHLDRGLAVHRASIPDPTRVGFREFRRSGSGRSGRDAAGRLEVAVAGPSPLERVRIVLLRHVFIVAARRSDQHHRFYLFLMSTLRPLSGSRPAPTGPASV